MKTLARLLGLTGIVGAAASTAAAQATSMTLPEVTFAIQTAGRLARASALGSLPSRVMRDSDAEIRIWTGFGASGIEGMAMRRESGGWKAWYMSLGRCSISLERWIADTASVETMARLRAMASQACGITIARPGYATARIDIDSLQVIPLPALKADSLWAALLAAGIRDVPLDNGPPVPLTKEVTSHVIELREGARYRASEIRSDPDSPARQQVAAIVALALKSAKAVRPDMRPGTTGVAGAYASALGDTTAARFLMESVFQSAAYNVARGALAKEPHPWLINLPTAPLAEWARYRDHFLSAVGGRPSLPTDTLRSSLYVSAFEMHGDTLVAQYSIGYGWKCGDRWYGDATGYEMRAVRHGTAWESQKTRITLFSDGISCPRRRP